MNTIKRLILAAGLLLSITVAPSANAILFTITNVSISPGSGYGIDPNGPESLLGVQFPTTSPTLQNFNLNAPGESYTFNIGSVSLNETNINGAEASTTGNRLDVSATFTFTDPLGINAMLTTTGIAATGGVGDPSVDFSLTWSPLNVPFGSGGLFKIALNDVSFSRITGTNPNSSDPAKLLTATVTLLGAPSTIGDRTVPEPATNALVVLGLFGFAAYGRKSARIAVI